MACVPGSQWLISADPNCPGMGGDAFLQSFLAEQGPEQQTIQLAPLNPTPFSVTEADVAPIPDLVPTYETSPQTGSMILSDPAYGYAALTPLPLLAPETTAPPLLTGEELTAQLMQKTFAPSGSVLAEQAGPSLFESIIAGKTFTPAALATEGVFGGPLALASIPLGVLQSVEAAATPEILAQAGIIPPADLAGTIDVASMFPSLQPQPLETQAGGIPPPTIPPVETLTDLPQPTPNIGDIVVETQPLLAQEPPNVGAPVAFYDPTGLIGGLPQVLPGAASAPSSKPSSAASLGPLGATAPLALGATSPAPLPAVSPAPQAQPATQTQADVSPVLQLNSTPANKPTFELNPTPSTRPQTQTQPQSQKCEPKKQTRNKRKPRTVCHRGTYVEHKTGLSKSPKETIECQ